jgi:DeoR/GlpR family transcriptional regulator of sugar metabolism
VDADTVKPTFAAERRDRILELVRANGTMALREIAERVNASEVTIRRDVRALEAEGLLDRRRGGAALPGRLSQDSARRGPCPETDPVTLAIARRAAALIRDGDAVVLGPGATTEALARELTTRSGLTVVTDSLPAATALAQAPGVEVVMTGGTLHRDPLALVGDAEKALTGLRMNRALLSGAGINGERGLSTRNPAVAAVERAMAHTAEEVIVLADHTKVGAETMVQSVPPEQITHLVTDSQADPEFLLELEECGITVHVAVPGPERGH